MPTLEQILSDPGYQVLTPGERTGIRRAFYQQTVKDPGFQGLKPEERHGIARDILFPASEYPEREREARPKPTTGEMFARGIERIGKGIRGEGAESIFTGRGLHVPTTNIVEGTLEIAASPLAPVANLVTRAGERISDYLTGKGYRRVGDVAAGLTTGVGDYATGIGLAKALQLARAPVARALPTVKERLAALETAKAERLAANLAQKEVQLGNVERMAMDAQARTVGTQAERLRQVPAAREAVQERGAQGIAAVEQELAAQQQRVGMEATKAAAPVGPKRMNFERRYTDLERVADQVSAQPVNLNTAAYKITREPGLPGVPTTPAETSAAGLSQTISEGVAGQIEEEIKNQVRRMITAAPEAKAVNYNAITKSVLGNATSSDVSVGELLRTRRRLRAAQRVAYEADHKNLARQFGHMEEAISKDIAVADKRIARIAANVDRDYFKKKAADWYAQGVDQAFDPATGVWDRKRFTTWWEKHADTTTNDKDLRRLLGPRYEQTKGLIDDMQKATELNIEQAAKEAARNIRRRTGQEMRAVGVREEQLGKLSQETGKQIQAVQKQGKEAVEKHVAEKAKAIEREFDEKITQLVGKPFHFPGRLMGSLAVVGGIHSIGYGAFTANPAAIGSGVMAIGGGLFTIAHAQTFAKIVNNAHGHSLIRRAIRAAPGTGEAIAASSAIMRFAQGLEAKEGETAAEQATGQSAKEAFLKKYGIE